jgi:hypothetical protein
MGHDVVPSSAGLAQFGWVNAAFVCGTIIFALSLQVIIRRGRQIQGLAEKAYEGLREVRNKEIRQSIIKGSRSRRDEGFLSLAQLRRRVLRGGSDARTFDIEQGTLDEP